jgi:hypothetical protein
MSVVFQETIHGQVVTKLLYQAVDFANTSYSGNTTFVHTDGVKEIRSSHSVGGVVVNAKQLIFLTAADAAPHVNAGLLALVDNTALSTLIASGSTFTINLNSANH